MRHESVLLGKDNEALTILINLHAVESPSILDCTYNKGKMWKGTDYRPFRMDINPNFDLDIVGDFTKMPFENETFDVIVFDPPHLPTNAASKNSSKIWEESYGITSSGAGREEDNVSGMFAPFLKEAKRVLKQKGIVLAKLADIIHNHKYQWHLLDYVHEVKNVGMTPCDLLIKKDPCSGRLKSSKWKNVKHLRRVHSYWIVARKGKCEK